MAQYCERQTLCIFGGHELSIFQECVVDLEKTNLSSYYGFTMLTGPVVGLSAIYGVDVYRCAREVRYKYCWAVLIFTLYIHYFVSREETKETDCLRMLD